jgi:hypothetical protein
VSLTKTHVLYFFLFQSGDCIDELDDSVDAVISSPDRHQTLRALFMTRHLQQLNPTVRIKDHSSPYQKSLNNNSSVITISEKFKESLITAQQCRCSSRSRFTGSGRVFTDPRNYSGKCVVRFPPSHSCYYLTDRDCNIRVFKTLVKSRSFLHQSRICF